MIPKILQWKIITNGVNVSLTNDWLAAGWFILIATENHFSAAFNIDKKGIVSK